MAFYRKHGHFPLWAFTTCGEGIFFARKFNFETTGYSLLLDANVRSLKEIRSNGALKNEVVELREHTNE